MSTIRGQGRSARPNRATLVWFVLLAATVATAVLGLEDRTHSAGIGVALLGLSFFKVRLVIMNFMELRAAPLALRVIADGWIVGALVLLVVIYLTGQPI